MGGWALTLEGDRPILLNDCHPPMTFSSPFPLRPVVPLILALGAITLGGCETTTTDQYQASAITTYTWYVDYEPQGQGGADRPPRIEKFGSTSLENKNGQQPPGAVGDADDQGLWWPNTPPRPTVDELEARQGRQERIGRPRLQRTVDYRVTLRLPGEENRVLSARYETYRQVVKAYEDRVPLEFVMDPTETIITKARPVY